jgi:hypothetical protein
MNFALIPGFHYSLRLKTQFRAWFIALSMTQNSNIIIVTPEGMFPKTETGWLADATHQNAKE